MPGRPRKRMGVAKAGSGIQDDGAWVPAFEGQRPPFIKGNTVARTHGFFARITRDEDREEIAEVASWLADQAPPEHPEAPLILLAAMWVRWARGNAFLLSNAYPDTWPKALLHHLPVVENSMARLMRGLAMTSEGAAAVGLQVAHRRRVEGGTGYDEVEFTEREKAAIAKAEMILHKKGVL